MTDGRNERVNLTTWTGIAIKVVIRAYFRPEVYKLYQFTLPSIAESKNLFIIIRNLTFLEINILAILRKITQATAAKREVEEGGGLAPPRQSDTRENTYHSKYEALTQCCSTIGPTSSRRHDIKTTLCHQCLELTGFGHSQSENSRRWHNISPMVARHLQHWASIIPALVHQYIGLNAINIHPMVG